MTRDELDLIRCLFRNASYEQIPALWYQYGEVLLSEIEAAVAQREEKQDETLPGRREGGSWYAAYAYLRAEHAKLVQEAGPSPAAGNK